jgi:uncharacterized protein (DUF433 family)
MIQPNPKPYVQEDEHGVLLVGNTRVMLDSVVASFEEGHTAESILDQYPALSLAEVYGAIAYYLTNRDEVRAYLQRQQAQWDALRQKSAQQLSEPIRRLRAIKQSRAAEGK